MVYIITTIYNMYSLPVFTQNDISNSTSSSNESVSSDLGINHNHSMNHYSSYSPEKTKRVNPVLYATSYRSQQGNVYVFFIFLDTESVFWVKVLISLK